MTKINHLHFLKKDRSLLNKNTKRIKLSYKEQIYGHLCFLPGFRPYFHMGLDFSWTKISFQFYLKIKNQKFSFKIFTTP